MNKKKRRGRAHRLRYAVWLCAASGVFAALWLGTQVGKAGDERAGDAPEAREETENRTGDAPETQMDETTGAWAEDGQTASVGEPEKAAGRPLIQATTPKEEYLGLVHLELLVSKENYNGNMPESIQEVLPTVVQIQTGGYLGSGIILEINEDTLLVASNRHQLKNQEFSRIRLYNGENVSGRCVYLSEEYDLGFALADISALSYEARSQLRSVSVSESCQERLSRGTEMFFVGSTDGVACNIYEGTIADPWYYFDEFGSYMIYNYCKAKAGMSGGGTYDGHGHCIGIITGGREDETASLPMQTIMEEREKAGL